MLQIFFPFLVFKFYPKTASSSAQFFQFVVFLRKIVVMLKLYFWDNLKPANMQMRSDIGNSAQNTAVIFGRDSYVIAYLHVFRQHIPFRKLYYFLNKY